MLKLAIKVTVSLLSMIVDACRLSFVMCDRISTNEMKDWNKGVINCLGYNPNGQLGVMLISW